MEKIKRRIIPRGTDIKGLKTIKILEMIDVLSEVDYEKLLNKTQKRIVEALRKREFVSQKELLKELRIAEQTLITNIKKLEEAGIVFSNRSSTKMLALNPAVFYWNDIMKVTKEHILLNAQLLDKLWEMRGKKIKVSPFE